MNLQKAKKLRSEFNHGTSIALFLIFVFILLRFSFTIREAIIYGIRLSATVVIPSVFPFMILSDFLNSIPKTQNGILKKLYEHTFLLPKKTASAFIIGNLCGFPLGIKSATEIYKQGELSRDQYTRLCAIANNPSIAFTVIGVGGAMRGSMKDGVTLYLSVVLSSFIIGMITRSKECISANTDNITEQNFDLSNSIKSAGYTSISISSYIIFFCALAEVLNLTIKSKLVLLTVSPLLEVSRACDFINSSPLLDAKASMIFTAFALGFSGFSVHLQGFSLMPREVSKMRYLSLKFAIGLLAALFILIST